MAEVFSCTGLEAGDAFGAAGNVTNFCRRHLFDLKTHGAIVAALNDVPRNPGDEQARSARHGGTLWQLKVTVYQE